MSSKSGGGKPPRAEASAASDADHDVFGLHDPGASASSGPGRAARGPLARFAGGGGSGMLGADAGGHAPDDEDEEHAPPGPKLGRRGSVHNPIMPTLPLARGGSMAGGPSRPTSALSMNRGLSARGRPSSMMRPVSAVSARSGRPMSAISRSGRPMSAIRRSSNEEAAMSGMLVDDDPNAQQDDSAVAEAIAAELEEMDDEDLNADVEGQDDVPVCFRITNHPTLHHDALWIFDGTNKFRLLLLHLVNAKPFEGFIILLIIANCIVLAIDDPKEPEPEWSINLNYFFVAAFTVEMLLKIVAFGFVLHAHAYLRSGWNRLDFIIVILSYLTFIPGFGNYTALRAFRVLRPLRSMNAIPPLRQIVTVLLRSLSGLVDVLLLIGFLFSIFGVFAVQLFMGLLRQRCRDDATMEVTEALCAKGNTYGGVFGVSCPVNHTCITTDENPNDGYTNYDNVLWAWLVIVQVLTMEDWASVMYMLMSTYTFFASIYFVVLVILGAYLVLNLALAVISAEFEFAQEELEERERFEKERAELQENIARGEEALRATRSSAALPLLRRSASVHSHTSYDDGRATPSVLVTSPLKKKTSRTGMLDISGTFASSVNEDDADASGGRTITPSPGTHLTASQQQQQDDRHGGASSEPSIEDDDDSDDSAEERLIEEHRARSSPALLVAAETPTDAASQSGSVRDNRPTLIAVSGDSAIAPASGDDNAASAAADKQQRSRPSAAVVFTEPQSPIHVASDGVSSRSERDAPDGEPASPSSPATSPDDATGFERLRLKLYLFVEGDPEKSEADRGLTPFGKFIIVCILLNTAVLAADYHGASQMQQDVSLIANYVFAAIFGLEMILKLVTFTPLGYLRDSINVFDGFIVIVSFIEIGLGGDARFSVLRAFRLLRVFKLLKSFPSLLAIVEVIAFAVRDTAYLNVLILLYLFIASLVGMQFFGASYPEEDSEGEAIRSRFDNFIFAFFTVFQIMTRDDWPGLMHTAMKYTSSWAFLYFIACVVAGDLVILNLFLSVIISSFDKVGRAQDERRLKELEEDMARKKRKKNPRGMAITLSDGLDGRITTVQDLQLGGNTNLQRRDLVTLEAGHTVENMLFSKGDVLNEEVFAQVAQRQQTNEALGLDIASPKAGAKSATGAAFDGSPKHVAQGADGEEDSTSDSQRGSSDPASERAIDFGEMVRIAQSMHHNHVGTDIVGVCARCGDPIMKPFPTASKDIEPPSPEDLHDRFCDRVQVRKAKQSVIRKLIGELNKKALLAAEGRGRAQPTPTYIEDLFGRAWETGLMLGEDFDEHVADPSWDRLRAALREEEEVLNLRVGEDQFGWSLVAYTKANVPGETMTNGGVSLFIFGRKNPLRVWCTTLINNPWFDRIIMTCIVLSSLLLAIDDPRRPNSQTNATLEIVGDFFTAIFIAEMVIKVIALGFVLHPSAYLRDPWNVLDFCIVIISILGIALRGVADVGFLKVLRTFRALRPLRVINRNRGLKMVVVTLIESIKGIFNVALITFLIWLVFAILGTQLFGGRLYYCTDDTINRASECHGAYFADHGGVNSSVMQYWSSIPGNASNVSGYPYRMANGELVEGVAIRDWVTYDYNFDNSYNSFMTLFVIATLDDWSTKMYYTIDSTGVDTGPEKNAHLEFSIYFIAFIMIGSFFFLSLFVGVVIRQYNITKDDLDGLSFLTPEQKHWVETQRMVLNFRPTRRNHPPNYVPIAEQVITAIDVEGDVAEEANVMYNHETGEYEVIADVNNASLAGSFRADPSARASTNTHGTDGYDTARPGSQSHHSHNTADGDEQPQHREGESCLMWLRVKVFHLVEHTGFELTTGALVLLCIVIIAMERYGQSEEWDELQRWSNVAFVIAFFLEFAFKAFGLGAHQYFRDGWNQFDFFLVIVGFVSLLEQVDLPINPNTLRVLRIFRIMRLLTLVKKAKGVRMLLETLWYSLPSLGNISLFLLLVFFIFAVLGVQLFANVKPSEDGEYDDEWSNFKHFGNSFLMLVRITTMDNWGVILTATSNTKDCGTVQTEYGKINNCGAEYAPVYYVVFLIIAVFVLLNVFVAVILDNFNTTLKLDHSEVNVMDLKRFSDAWARFDEEANMIVETRHFPSLLTALKPPLGLARSGDRVGLLLLAMKLQIPEHGGIIHFAETLIPLARSVQKVEFTDAELRDHEDSWKQQFPGLNELPILRYRQKRVTVDQYLAATYMQAARRRKLAQERLDHLREKKQREVDRWYEIREVPLHKRTASHRLQTQQFRRLAQRQQHNEEVAAKAEAAAAEADAEAEAAGVSIAKDSKKADALSFLMAGRNSVSERPASPQHRGSNAGHQSAVDGPRTPPTVSFTMGKSPHKGSGRPPPASSTTPRKAQPLDASVE